MRPIATNKLRAGTTRSCGCLKSKHITERAPVRHGILRKANLGVARCYLAMLHRCQNRAAKTFAHYGGRGIRVCDRWQTFENFVADMGPRPSPKHSIDRIDPNGHYETGNCRWATAAEQASNKRQTRRYEWAGESLTTAEWARRVGVRTALIYQRVHVLGWPIERAITTPVPSARG